MNAGPSPTSTGSAASRPAAPLQALGRGLDVLACLNRKGHATTASLARSLGLKRSTAHRLLRVLGEMGLVRFDAASGLYGLAAGVGELSRGFRDEPWIDDIVEPRLRQWTRSHGWPLIFCTTSGGIATIRVSTHEDGALLDERLVPGNPAPDGPACAAWFAASATVRLAGRALGELTMIGNPEAAVHDGPWRERLHSLAVALAAAHPSADATGGAGATILGGDHRRWHGERVPSQPAETAGPRTTARSVAAVPDAPPKTFMPRRSER